MWKIGSNWNFILFDRIWICYGFLKCVPQLAQNTLDYSQTTKKFTHASKNLKLLQIFYEKNEENSYQIDFIRYIL